MKFYWGLEPSLFDGFVSDEDEAIRLYGSDDLRQILRQLLYTKRLYTKRLYTKSYTKKI